MGSCQSRTSADHPTAKLVVTEEETDGLIREFPEHVKVEEILREKPGFFVCHADSMRYDEYISPLSAEDELQVEHLYFLLPLTRLCRPLPATDMAALAVEASAAMERSRHRHRKLGRRRGSKITPGVIMMEQEVVKINHLHRRQTYPQMISSSWRGELKDDGFNSETFGMEKSGCWFDVAAWPSKLQRTASERKRVNKASFNGPWRSKLETIHEEGF